MLRRQFIHRATLSMLAGAASSALPRLGLANAASWKEAFAAALENTPWLLAFRSATTDSFQAEAELEGRIPEDLSGTLYRNGPTASHIRRVCTNSPERPRACPSPRTLEWNRTVPCGTSAM